MHTGSVLRALHFERKIEATAVKKVLVSVGENRRIVFSSTPASSDAEILSKAIKETFGDVLKSGQ